MTTVPETPGQSAAFAFMEEHEILKKELHDAKARIMQLRDLNQELMLRVQMQESEIARLQERNDIWMQRAIELSANVLYGADAQQRSVDTAKRIADTLPVSKKAVSDRDASQWTAQELGQAATSPPPVVLNNGHAAAGNNQVIEYDTRLPPGPRFGSGPRS